MKAKNNTINEPVLLRLQVKIDVLEAVRRGFNVEEKMILEVDVTKLPYKERSTLSRYLMGRNFKNPVTHVWPALPEPTIYGLRALLQKLP